MKQTIQNIHCTVSCNDQFRRFLFIGTEFSSLFAQVKQLLALDKEFVLKYKDTEGDLITLTSNEELACALGYSDKNVLRLVAVSKDDSSISDSNNTSDSDSPVCSRGFPRDKRGRGCHGWKHHMYGPRPIHGGHGGFYESYGSHRRHGGCHGWEQHMNEGHGPCHGREQYMHGGHGRGSFHGGYGGCHGWEQMHGGHGHGLGKEMFKERLTSKRDCIKSKLDELEKVTEKTPEQQQKVLRLQWKLKKIESHLERGCWEKKGKGKHCGKWADKMEKKRQKMERRMSKREKKEKCSTQNLSEEAQTKIAMLRSQIDVVKPKMKEVKSQIKTKKEALKEAKETGKDPKQLFTELSNLKEKRKTLKNEIRPLKEKIRELKYVSC